MTIRTTLKAAVFTALCTTMPAAAVAEQAGLAETLNVDAPEWDIGNLNLRLGGFAEGALFGGHQAGGPSFAKIGETRASGEIRSSVRLQRIFDNGMVLGAFGDVLVYHDGLSSDRYGSDTVERLAVFAQTGIGRLEIGQTDGAAYALKLVGPILDEEVSLEDRSISLFRDPVTGRDFARFFKQETAVQTSSNDAKMTFLTPRILGIQIGLSYTPQTIRSPLPFTGNPNDRPDQQQSLWEVAAGYTGYFSDVALGLSAGFAHGTLKNRTALGADLYDWSVGTQLAYRVSDVRLSLGAAFRGTNAYLLDVTEVLDHGHTHALHLGTMAEKGPWAVGANLSNADVEGPVDFHIRGYQATGVYHLNEHLQISAGWQWYDYRRDIGAFYNGNPAIDMNAGFLTLSYAL